MSSRYQTTLQIKDAKGTRHAETTIIAPVPATGNDLYIRTVSMERLDKLALDFYNDGSLWWVIAAANGLGKGTLVVQPNTRLRIPSETGVQDRIQQANKQR
jgi:hypothetical protein